LGVQPINWRSEIMNFTLSLIYPAPNEQGIKNISVSELVCVVNADQTCSAAFFDNLLRFLDSGAFLTSKFFMECSWMECFTFLASKFFMECFFMKCSTFLAQKFIME
jgi:hypothetical protein